MRKECRARLLNLDEDGSRGKEAPPVLQRATGAGCLRVENSKARLLS